ncbi:unnamed protein product [Laminaria digitata]
MVARSSKKGLSLTVSVWSRERATSGFTGGKQTRLQGLLRRCSYCSTLISVCFLLKDRAGRFFLFSWRRSNQSRWPYFFNQGCSRGRVKPHGSGRRIGSDKGDPNRPVRV